jgi:hypothetical protein
LTSPGSPQLLRRRPCGIAAVWASEAGFHGHGDVTAIFKADTDDVIDVMGVAGTAAQSPSGYDATKT